MLRQLGISRAIKRPFLYSFRNASSGRATKAGTRYFLEQSKLKLHHSLKKSHLYINPIIVDVPMAGTGQSDEIDTLYIGAVVKNRSNCFHVYANKPEGVWHSLTVKKLTEAGIDREGLVTIANIGKVRTKDDIIKYLDEAWELTQQEYIDIAIMTYDSDWKEGIEGNFQECMDFMEELCANKILHSYGFTLDIEPFTQHTPPVGGHFKNAMVPLHLENYVTHKLPHCELVLYPLAPTHAMSTATTMLPEEQSTMDALDGGAASISPFTFSRAAVHPLSCYRGHGNPLGDQSDPLSRLETMDEVNEDALMAAVEQHRQRLERDGLDKISGAPRPDDPVVLMVNRVLPPDFSGFFGELFDRICPKLASTPLIEHKVLRIVMSYGHDLCVIEPEVCALMEKISLTKNDILHIDEVANIFGGFMISEEIDAMMREAQRLNAGTDNADMELSQEDQAFLDDISTTIGAAMEPKHLKSGESKALDDYMSSRRS